jgi:protein-S-isoprenylcysteine O-methyltransferase Ste14
VGDATRALDGSEGGLFLNWNSASRIGFGIAVLAILGLLWRRALFAGGPVAAGVQLAAVVLMLWARVVFGRRSFHASAGPTEGGLVTSGPYRLIRHPIYAAVLVFVLAGVASHLSLPSVLLFLAAVGGLGVRIAAEERLVVARYPEYAAYASRTKRVIPYVF